MWNDGPTGAPNGRSDSPARLQAAVANLGLGEQVLTGAAEIAPPVQRSVARIARQAIEFCRIAQIDWIVPRLAAEIIRTRRDAEPGGRLPAIQKPGVGSGPYSAGGGSDVRARWSGAKAPARPAVFAISTARQGINGPATLENTQFRAVLAGFPFSSRDYPDSARFQSSGPTGRAIA